MVPGNGPIGQPLGQRELQAGAAAVERRFGQTRVFRFVLDQQKPDVSIIPHQCVFVLSVFAARTCHPVFREGSLTMVSQKSSMWRAIWMNFDRSTGFEM